MTSNSQTVICELLVGHVVSVLANVCSLVKKQSSESCYLCYTLWNLHSGPCGWFLSSGWLSNCTVLSAACSCKEFGACLWSYLRHDPAKYLILWIAALEFIRLHRHLKSFLCNYLTFKKERKKLHRRRYCKALVCLQTAFWAVFVLIFTSINYGMCPFLCSTSVFFPSKLLQIV